MNTGLYISTIDAFIYQILDLLHDSIQTGKKAKNFEDILDNIKMPIGDIEKTLNNKENIHEIVKICQKYLYIYLFLNMGFTNDIDVCRKQIIKYLQNENSNLVGGKESKTSKKNASIEAPDETTDVPKNHTTNFVIDQELSSIILGAITVMKDVDIIMKNIKDIDKVADIDKKKDAIELLNSIGEEMVQNIIDSGDNYKHNIIKLVVFRLIYLIKDKKKIANILDDDEFSVAEQSTINVVESLMNEIEFTTFQMAFSVAERKNGMGDFMFEMLTENDKSNTQFLTRKMYMDNPLSVDDKINELFEKKILIPITDDFLRYNKDKEKHTSSSAQMQKTGVKKKDNTLIRFIVTKMNKIKDFYVIMSRGNKTEIDELKKYFPPNNRKMVIINNLEEVSIISKMLKMGEKVIEENEYYDDLIQIRKYAYVNFRDINENGFNFRPSTTVTAYRGINFEVQQSGILQTRVISPHVDGNVIGVAINPFKLESNYRSNGAPCIKVDKTKKMGDNGYTTTLNMIKSGAVSKKMHYWLFDRNKDIMDMSTYQNYSQMNFEAYFKLLLGNIHDEINTLTYETIINKINKTKNMTIRKMYAIIDKVQKTLINIEGSQYYNEIINYVYYNKLNIKGYSGKVEKREKRKIIKLPVYEDDKKDRKVVKIRKQEFLTGEKKMDNELSVQDAVCQHHITWENINTVRKTNPNAFGEYLSQFIKKYVIETKNDDFICKSCYQAVDVKKYVHETFAGEVSNVALEINLEVNLENLAEYEKYSRSINNMDKIVNKMAYIIGLQSYIGTQIVSKRKRQVIIKNTIDIILMQYKVNKDAMVDLNYKRKRDEIAMETYGITNTQYFIFNMSDDLFTYSSNDEDKYKKPKSNNILAYFVFLFICEMTPTQIINFNYDKLININIFEKYMKALFDGIYIRVNDGDDLAKVLDYPLLCYVIYYMSAQIIKYNYWHYDNTAYDSKKNTINPQLHKIIINTIMHLINDILYQNTKKDRNYIYEHNASKFFIRLNTVYRGKQTIEQLRQASEQRINIVDNKIKVKTEEQFKFILDGETYNRAVDNVNKDKMLKYQIKSYNGINRVDENDVLRDKLYERSVNKIYANLGPNGKPRTKLAKVDLSKDEVDDYAANIQALNTNKIYNMQGNVSNIVTNEHVSELANEYTGDILATVDRLVHRLESIIGKNTNINNKNLYLRSNVYVISNDNMGNKIEPLYVLETDTKTKYNEHYKKDVISYTNKNSNTTMYYDAVDLYYLGYRDANKNNVDINTNNYIYINRSIYEKIMMMGHIKHVYDGKKMTDVIRTRINNLKSFIKTMQSYLYQIKNKKKVENDVILKAFMDKFNDLRYYKEDGDRIFENWGEICDNVFVNKVLDEEQITAMKIINLNNNDNLLLYYICREIEELIRINDNDQNKYKLALMLVMIIDESYNKFMTNERIKANNEVQILQLITYDVKTNTDNTDTIIDVDQLVEYENLTDEQKIAYDNQVEDNKNREEALDVEIDCDNCDEADDGMENIRIEGD